MKNIPYFFAFIILLFSCSNYRKLSTYELKKSKFEKNYSTILNKYNNVAVFKHHIFEKSKLIFIDEKGGWNLIKWNNNDFKKVKLNGFPKYLISDSLIVEIQDEIYEKSNKLKYAYDSSSVKFEFKYPANLETINYKKGNIETFKKENFRNEYLKITQQIITN